MMDTHSPSHGVLETVVTDEALLKNDASTHASRGKDVTQLSKHVMKAYRRAKEAGEERDAKSRQICAVLRAKRDGIDPPVDPVIREESTSKVQTLLSDF